MMLIPSDLASSRKRSAVFSSELIFQSVMMQSIASLENDANTDTPPLGFNSFDESAEMHLIRALESIRVLICASSGVSQHAPRAGSIAVVPITAISGLNAKASQQRSASRPVMASVS